MRLLDELCHYDTETATCRVSLTEDSSFMRDRRVAAVVAIEYLAQCVAAYATLYPSGPVASAVQASKPRIGYLVGVRRLDLMAEYFVPGDELMVTVKHVWGGAEGAQFEGLVKRAGAVVASATLTVFHGAGGVA